MITAIDQGEREATQDADCSQDTKISPASGQQQHRRYKSPDRQRINSSRSTSRLNEISVKHESRQVQLRTRQLTVCLLLLAGSISSLTPFLTLHLTNRVGLLLFESDILQLRSSLICVSICFTFLVILDLIIILFSKTRTRFTESANSTINYLFTLDKRRSLLLQKLLKQCIGLLAITSILAYLSLALIVPHISQLQRTPFATFDCNANLITIENCQQQFTSDTGDDSLLDSVQLMLAGDLNGNGGRLAKRLECLKYNDESLERLRVPTRFLLSKCGLICEPQRQQLHQFGDDLNSDLGTVGPQHRARPLAAPYSQPDYDQPASYNNSQASGDDNLSPSSADGQLVSLKLCFSGEINGEGSGGSNYLRFCIENLTNGQSGKSHRGQQKDENPEFLQHPNHRDQTLTVGQLNAILSHRQQSSQHGQHQAAASLYQSSSRSDQSTHYVNPIVQFESHFKNWPHLTRASTAFTSSEGTGYFPGEKSAENDSAGSSARAKSSWCKFKPMPPFIVNNKPFSDLHCSLEHDYLMSTGSPLLEASQRRRRRRRRQSSTPKIYLRKPSSPNDLGHSERCNIGCQVNILYQVTRHEREGDNGERVMKTSRLGATKLSSSLPAASYYLPLKSCLIVRGDKDRTAQYYLWFRATADASLLLTFILVDILLMIESMDTKQFQLEGKKVRLLGLLLAVTLLPLLAASLFDLTASWPPTSAPVPGGRTEGHLVQFINDRLIPSMSETFAKLEAYLKPPVVRQQQRLHTTPHEDLNSTLADHATRARTQDLVIVDNYLVPFFIYAVLMFAFAINSFKLPLVASTPSPLMRVTSTEELGMVDSARTAVKTSVASPHPKARHIATGKTKSLDILSEPQSSPSLSSKRSENARKLTPFARTPAKLAVSSVPRDSPTNLLESSQSKSSARPVALFAMLTLFMGLQFNLSQITQTQILIETFNIQTDLTQQQQHQTHHHNYERPGKVAIPFVLVANSCGTIFILILALLFSDELSIFLAQLFPFKPASKVRHEHDLGRREQSVRFKKFISISLVVYALRYFVLANMSAQMSKMKWFLAILFQSTELLNFPLTWFELASRSHEMLLVKESQAEKKQDSDQARTTSNIHLLVQSTLAFVYFALARPLALFVHSLHAGLYLHSDNVDWFIESFYGSDATRSGTKQSMSTIKQQQTANGTTSTAPAMDALFIPLPSERQTYLHASRSFTRYNSLICLAVALGFLLVFAYERYRLWIDRKRFDLIQRRAQSPSERESDLIDERLSLDLTRIHSRPGRDKSAREGHLHRHKSETTVFTHPPRSSLARRHQAAADSTATDDDESERPRARIHFRYDLGLRRNASSSDSSLSNSSSAGTYYPGGRVSRSKTGKGVAGAPRLSNESRVIPIILEEEPNEWTNENRQVEEVHEQGQVVSSAEEEVEQFTRTRTARMLVEDEEEWSLGGGEGDEHERQARGASGMATTTKNRRFVDSALATAACSPPPPGFADDDYLPDATAFELDPPAEFDEPSPSPPPPNQRSSRAPVTRTLPLASEQQQQQQKRRITFGPTTTFFGRGGDSGRESGDQYSSAMLTTPSASARQHPDNTSRDNGLGARGRRRSQTSARTLVSPEPSIDGDDDFEYSNNQAPATEDNNYWRETSLRTSSVSRTTSDGRAIGRQHHHSRRSASDDMDSIDN